MTKFGSSFAFQKTAAFSVLANQHAPWPKINHTQTWLQIRSLIMGVLHSFHQRFSFWISFFGRLQEYALCLCCKKP
ncbi:hypothetical protein M407DRAFT_87470 [Tulasnella calospora MUT 4182]|uniref:Uncharacterized protein n=1 Tax=Tulasnella calospora MUT 4182 TaxID=1051891 RepID=A0A0C3QWY3_9AGAM|nr:hypothetical protein M407DRAFT_87470 [Tulasnella calospora MUT 4182]